METIIYRIKFKDGRRFNVFCANRAQKIKFSDTLRKIRHLTEEVNTITNGIHNFSQWSKIVDNL
jgi:uncharacterized protein with NRDE domain